MTMAFSIRRQQSHPRSKVDWPIEYAVFSSTHGIIHERSKLVDFSKAGICFLTMCKLEVGMELTFHLKMPGRKKTTVTLRGEVVRVDENADMFQMFKAVGVKWTPDSTLRLLFDEAS
jgi:hypothetical protein